MMHIRERQGNIEKAQIAQENQDRLVNTLEVLEPTLGRHRDPRRIQGLRIVI